MAQAVHLFWIADGRLESREVAELGDLLSREDGFIWLDADELTPQARQILEERFAFHEQAVEACGESGFVPRILPYDDYAFVEMHASEPGRDGFVYSLVLNTFVGRHFFVTVHEPRPELDQGIALRDTQALLRRLEAGEPAPDSPAAMFLAVILSIGERMESQVRELSGRVADFEREALVGEHRDPQTYLESMFRVRHQLVTVQTIAAHNYELCARMHRLSLPILEIAGHPTAGDLVDQFARVQHLCAAERDFLQMVLNLYETRVTTRINLAMERLALITAVALPVTALASIYGMNNIVNSTTQVVQLALSLVTMLVLVAAMLWWTRRQRWW